jgi:hypothetical protein
MINDVHTESDEFLTVYRWRTKHIIIVQVMYDEDVVGDETKFIYSVFLFTLAKVC